MERQLQSKTQPILFDHPTSHSRALEDQGWPSQAQGI
jgi:hypothetical protein